MVFTNRFIVEMTNNYDISWKDKSLMYLIFMKENEIINQKSFIDLSLSIIRGKTPERRNTYKFDATGDWFNDERTVDIFEYIWDKYGKITTTISFEKMISYVNAITGQPRNFVINNIFDIFIKPMMIQFINNNYDNELMDRVIKACFEVDFNLQNERSFITKYEPDFYEDDEVGYSSYERGMVSNMLKTKFHKIAKTYYKGQFYLNPRYTKTEDFDYNLHQDYHIFEIISSFNEPEIKSLTDTKNR